MKLADFLLARIAEDEAAAILARDGDDWHHSVDCDVCAATYAARDKYGDGDRVLAECRAKRLIMEECDDWLAGASHWSFVEASDEEGAIVSDHVLRLLALPYADHPDYRSEWVPASRAGLT